MPAPTGYFQQLVDTIETPLESKEIPIPISLDKLEQNMDS
jgi:hypothetical protein